MNRAYRILPVYTGDVSGACSALYELGGMTVIHDPSGCNSTYNTHDETRWYEEDSLIFLSGLSELDAILGNDEKFIRDVADAAETLRPRFIALVGSPIPYLNGTDFAAIARLIGKKTGIPAFFVPTNGMHDYTVGAGNALSELARRAVLPADKKIPGTVNLLGVTPLDFRPEEAATLRAIIEAQGWRVLSCWAIGETLENIRCSAAASLDLVVSAAGLSAAKELRRRFGTPWTAGVPVGAFAPALFDAMEQAAKTGDCGSGFLRRPAGEGDPAIFIGEPVTMGSLACAFTIETGRAARVLCPLETHSGLLGENDLAVRGEEEAEAALRQAKAVVADPLYRPICREDCRLLRLPHQAFSGRCFRKERKNLFGLDWGELIDISGYPFH